MLCAHFDNIIFDKRSDHTFDDWTGTSCNSKSKGIIVSVIIINISKLIIALRAKWVSGRNTVDIWFVQYSTDEYINKY